MTMNKLLATIGLLMLLQNAWAIDIGDAKAQGLVGSVSRCCQMNPTTSRARPSQALFGRQATPSFA
jgi:hypothetical protein